MAGIVRADRRLWLTEDRAQLVEDGDPRAAFLWASGPGAEVLEDEAARVGYRADKSAAASSRERSKDAAASLDAPDIGQHDATGPAEPETSATETDQKAQPKPQDKAVRGHRDKRR